MQRHLCISFFSVPSIFTFTRPVLVTMLHSSLFLCLLLVSAIGCGPAEPQASRWGGGWGHGASTGVIAGGVFPLPCDCLSKCVSIYCQALFLVLNLHTGCPKKTLFCLQRPICLVFKHLFGKVIPVLKTTCSQLSFEHKNKSILFQHH